jgi:hypothetical protein
MVTLCALLCAGSNAVRAQVAINEVMFNPVGSEFFDEYIELYNYGNSAIDLTGWRIGDGEGSDGFFDVGKGLVLLPDRFALVLDADYFDRSTSYDPLPYEALILTVDGPTLGNGGLNNSTDERVVLISVDGDTVSAVVYRAPNAPGVSEEKVDPVASDDADNWVDSRWVGGTPGRVNSVSAKRVDISVRAVTDSIRVPWMQSASLDCVVQNRGREPVAQIRVQVNGLPNAVSLEAGFLAAGDSTRLVVDIGTLPGGVYEITADGQLAGDEDPLNQTARWIVSVGFARGIVVINEVMAAPKTGDEWVELLNLGNDAIDLRGWRLADVTTEGFVVRGEISGRGLVVFSQDDATSLNLSSWPRLNNQGDVLVLRDVIGSVVDSVAYPPASMGVSLERIDPSAPGTDFENWLASTQGSTAAGANSVSAPKVDSVSLVADPNPFEKETRITYSLPVSRAHVDLWVFDRMGRKVRSLLDAAEAGSSRDIIWDGRSDQQQFLSPGVFVLYLEAHSSDGQAFRMKVPVVLTRGLDP